MTNWLAELETVIGIVRHGYIFDQETGFHGEYITFFDCYMGSDMSECLPDIFLV